MKRKLIKQGADALTVTLPKAWTQLHKLAAGDEIDITVDGAQLAIKAQCSPQARKIKLHMMDEETGRFLLTNAYRAGYDEIDLTSDVPEFVVHALVAELLGVEIINHSGNKFLLKVVALPDAKEYGPLFRRTFHIMQTGLSYLLEDMQTGSFNPDKMHLLKTNLVRLSTFCKRVIHTSIPQDKNISYAHYVILTLQDYCISQAAYLYAHAHEQKQTQYITACKEFYDSVDTVLFEGKPLSSLLDKKRNLFLLKEKTKSTSFVQELAVLVRLLTLFVGPLSVIAVERR